ncbi:hypothetical protein H0E87_003461 [Populus deltoides]|uniref:Bifunctional inhibitor/plant lipid transfer protein/seed storage helical domain-containing protein n=1 Tax=Populus deltoides TaxID=3696 RepID=A0A8T2ZZ13_POPDE|nr:hypothetical protein H0E87_003461 [Populus deltoides]
MAITNINSMMLLAVFAMTGILISSDLVARGQGCQGDLQGLITQCARFVQRAGPQKDPSQECCSAIKSVDIPCVCKYITGEIEAVVDMGKVVHVAASCGKPLDHGMKCGIPLSLGFMILLRRKINWCCDWIDSRKSGEMATLVSGRSTLNPNAPLFIPNVYRQVEDFSPEWWELVKTSTWFRDFWLSQHPEGSFDGSASAGADDDLTDLLPEDLDVGVEEFSNLEAQFEEMVMLAEAEEKTDFSATDPKVEMKPLNGLLVDVKALLNDLNVPKSPKDRNPRSPRTPTKYQTKPLHCVSGKRTALNIHQPR